jgi:cell division protein FtsL
MSSVRRAAFHHLRKFGYQEIHPLKAVVYIGIVAVSALALVWPHLELVRLGYQIGRIKGERVRLIHERRELRIEEATLRQLDRIEAIAREKLGMIFPGSDQVVYVKVNSSGTR